MKRYYPVVAYGRGTIPNAEMEESDDGLYVLASEAMAEIERLRGLVEMAYRSGVEEGTAWDDTPTDELWEHSLARRFLTPPTTTPNP